MAVFKFFEGKVNGQISESKRGTNGFGYDPIFIPDGYDMTFGEMAEDEKNKMSHHCQSGRKTYGILQNIRSIIKKAIQIVNLLCHWL